MGSVERFMAAFAGSEAAHGQTVVGRTKRNGKAEAKSFIVREPLTEKKVALHLSGGQGVGAIPINVDNRCKFGAIDVDDYDLDLKDVVRRVSSTKVPLVVCRSKSGGAHLYLFLRTWVDAAIMREYLTEIASALGFAGREIFPKQDTVLLERGDVGNFINLPYHNAENTLRYALDENGDALTLDEFLDTVERKRCDLADLEPIMLRNAQMDEAMDLKNFPPCMQRIVAMGGWEINRNIGLFHVGRAMKNAYPDTWKQALEEFNTRHMSPPLPAEEVAGVLKQLEKKDYGFMCKEKPMADFCDKELCRQVKYGIGSGHISFPTLTGLTIMMSDPRVYYVNVDGKRLELNVNELNSPREFQKKALNDLSIRPQMMKDADWGILVNKLLSEAVEVDVPPEATKRGRFLEHLEEFCTGRVRAMSPEEVQMNKPWTDKGEHFFKMKALMDFLKKKEFGEMNHAQVLEELKRIADGEDPMSHIAVRKEDGSRSTVRVCKIPAFTKVEVEVKLDEKKGGFVPF